MFPIGILAAATLSCVLPALFASYSWCRWQKAATAFFAWKKQNPGAYTGTSAEGLGLLRRLLSAYNYYVTICPERYDNAYWKSLLGYLDELPPKPPAVQPIEKSATEHGAFLFAYIGWSTRCAFGTAGTPAC
jgi:hypothetical protein